MTGTACLPKRRAKGLGLAVLMAMSLGLTGCGGDDMSELREYVQQVKQRPGGRIEPIPEIKAFESFSYPDDPGRSPFDVLSFAEPRRQETLESAASGPQPDKSRPEEALEAFQLDSLTYVGTIQRDSDSYALVQDPGGTIHRVTKGSYMGTNYGRITGITPTAIQLRELIPDQRSGWREREASLALND